MIRTVSLIFCALLFVSQLVIAAGNDGKLILTEEELAWINDNPVVRVGGELDWPPFDFVDEHGRYIGVFNDYLNLIAAKTGLRFEIETDSWSNLPSKLDVGKLDMLPAVYYTEERNERYLYTEKYHQVTEYIFARHDVDIHSHQDIVKKTVAMVKGFASIDKLKNRYPDIDIVEYNSVDEAINAVVTYRADLLFDSITALSHSLKQKSITNIKPRFTLDSIDPFDLHMMTHRSKPLLASIISKAIKTIGVDEKQTILSKWLMTVPQSIEDAIPDNINAVAKHKTSLTGYLDLIWQLSAALVLLIVLALLLNPTFRKMVNERLKIDSISMGNFRLLVTTGIVFFIIIVISLSIYGLDQTKNKVVADLQEQLKTVLRAVERQQETWLQSQRTLLKEIANERELILIAHNLSIIANDPAELLSSRSLADARNYFVRKKELMGVHGFFIIDVNGISIASSRDSNTGTQNLIVQNEPEKFQRVLTGETIFFHL